MGSELISIIIPVYNVDSYLEECLESVINQSYTNIEIILVNDGSCDSSWDICCRYGSRDKRIILINKVNEGLSITRNTGIKKSRGCYFASIDSDDILDKDYVKKLYEAIKSNDADICLCAREAFDEKNKKTFYLNNELPQCTIIDEKRLAQFYNVDAQEFQMSDTWNKLYSKKFVEEAGIQFYLNRKYNGTDLLFNHLLLLHRPRIAVVNEALYHYRIVPNSRVRRKNKPLQEGFEFITNELLKEADKCRYGSSIRKQIFLRYVCFLKYVSFDVICECENNKEAGQRFSQISKRHKEFMRQKGNCNIPCRFLPWNLGVFWILLQYGGSWGLSIYYQIRSLIKKL